MRIGQGYDVHKLVPERKLILGGVTIPYELGLAGHSDADVLLHAICDGLLGAAGLSDIGFHFPDTDSKYKNISSMKLLKKTLFLLKKKGFSIVNIDSTIVAQAPKLSPYREAMRNNIAGVLEIDSEFVNIKATTTEGLGFIGKGEGIAAMCLVLIS